MRNRTLLAFTLALGSAGVFGFEFEEVDIDGDGTVTREEFRERYGSLETFASWDTSDDGVLDDDELGVFDWELEDGSWDRDTDGLLTSGEVFDGLHGMFDADKDGLWSNDEWDEAGKAGLFD